MSDGILYRIKRVVVSFIDRFLVKIEDPVQVLEYEYQEDLKRLARARDGLAYASGLVRKVERQVKDIQSKIDQTMANIQAALATGEEASAGELALQLEELQDQLTQNKDQLEDHKKAYEAGLTTIQEAQRAMEEKKRRNEKLKAGLKMADADKLLAQIQTEFSDLQVAAGDQRSVERIQEQIDHAAGMRQAAADLATSSAGSALRQREQRKARANIALERYKSQMGLASGAAAEATPVAAPAEGQKTMGPEKAAQ